MRSLVIHRRPVIVLERSPRLDQKKLTVVNLVRFSCFWIQLKYYIYCET